MIHKYFIGKPLLFAISNEPARVGEIIDIIKIGNEICYKVREMSDKLTGDEWVYHEITEEQIVKINYEKFKPRHDDWTLEHIEEINKAFGQDISNRVLLTYDTAEQAAEDGMEEYLQSKWCRNVKEKWVLLIG